MKQIALGIFAKEELVLDDIDKLLVIGDLMAREKSGIRRIAYAKYVLRFLLDLPKIGFIKYIRLYKKTMAHFNLNEPVNPDDDEQSLEEKRKPLKHIARYLAVKQKKLTSEVMKNITPNESLKLIAAIAQEEIRQNIILLNLHHDPRGYSKTLKKEISKLKWDEAKKKAPKLEDKTKSKEAVIEQYEKENGGKAPLIFSYISSVRNIEAAVF